MKTLSSNGQVGDAAKRLGANRVFPLPDNALEGIDVRTWLSSLIWVELQQVLPCGEEARWAKIAVCERANHLLAALAEAEKPSERPPSRLRLSEPQPEPMCDLDAIERGDGEQD